MKLLLHQVGTASRGDGQLFFSPVTVQLSGDGIPDGYLWWKKPRYIQLKCVLRSVRFLSGSEEGEHQSVLILRLIRDLFSWIAGASGRKDKQTSHHRSGHLQGFFPTREASSFAQFKEEWCRISPFSLPNTYTGLNWMGGFLPVFVIIFFWSGTAQELRDIITIHKNESVLTDN